MTCCKSLLTLMMVSTIGLTVIQLAVSAGDAFSVGVLNAATDCNVAADTGTSSCFGTNVASMIALTSTSPIGTIGILILALIAILMTFVQVALMVVRSAMLVLLAGVLPLTASFTNTPTGNQWFRKSLGWLIAFILYKPAAALIYAAAFKLVGTDLFSKDDGGIWSIMTGMALMIMALIALPALMRFIAPMVSAAGGGAAGAAIVAAWPRVGGQAASGAMQEGRLEREPHRIRGRRRRRRAAVRVPRRPASGCARDAGGVGRVQGSLRRARSPARCWRPDGRCRSWCRCGRRCCRRWCGCCCWRRCCSRGARLRIAVIGAQKVAEGAKKAADATKSAVEDSAGEGPSGSQ